MMTYEVARFIAKNAALSGGALSVKEVTALNFLVTNLKMNGLWPSTGVLYPMVGVDAISHSLNLINPDNNRITWSGDSSGNHTAGTWTANTSGATGDTGLPGNTFSSSSVMLACYITATVARNAGDIGGGSNPNFLAMITNWNDATNWYFDAFNTTSGRLTANATTNTTGLQAGIHLSGTSTIYQRSTSVASSSISPGTPSSSSIKIGQRGEGTASGRTYALFQISPGLSSTQYATYYAIIQAYQTILGRQI